MREITKFERLFENQFSEISLILWSNSSSKIILQIELYQNFTEIYQFDHWYLIGWRISENRGEIFPFTGEPGVLFGAGRREMESAASSQEMRLVAGETSS